MEFINLTPHDVNVVCADGSVKTFSRSGTVARCEEERYPIDCINGIDVYRVRYGRVYDVPDRDEDDAVAYIVSMPVRLALPHRPDLFSPGELIRNEAGQPIGCKGLACNL